MCEHLTREQRALVALEFGGETFQDWLSCALFGLSAVVAVLVVACVC